MTSNTDVRLDYEGKKPEREILLTPPANCRQLWPEHRSDESNRLYYGDNLPILATLANDPAISGKVRLVYIDPPYATKSVFQSRNQADAYMDLLEGAHYLEFLRERLIFLRELLADDGSIYVHFDDNMAFHAKAIMDEVFGRTNFRSWITRKKCNPKNYTRKTYGNVADYILFTPKVKTMSGIVRLNRGRKTGRTRNINISKRTRVAAIRKFPSMRRGSQWRNRPAVAGNEAAARQALAISAACARRNGRAW